eukprot:14374317-Alexandrium_andersonii.AAC.1
MAGPSGPLPDPATHPSPAKEPPPHGFGGVPPRIGGPRTWRQPCSPCTRDSLVEGALVGLYLLLQAGKR